MSSQSRCEGHGANSFIKETIMQGVKGFSRTHSSCVAGLRFICRNPDLSLVCFICATQLSPLLEAPRGLMISVFYLSAFVNIDSSFTIFFPLGMFNFLKS